MSDKGLNNATFPGQVEANYTSEGEDEHRSHPSLCSIFRFARKSHSSVLALSLVLSVLSGFFQPAVPLFLGKIFDDLAAYGSGSITGPELLTKVSQCCIVLTCLGLASWAITGGFFSSWVIFGELQAKSVRDKLYSGLLARDMAWYDLLKDGIGSLLIRIQT